MERRPPWFGGFLNTFDLSEPVSIDELKRGQVWRLVWRRQALVAQLHPPQTSRGHLTLQHAALAAARGAGVPVAQVITSPVELFQVGDRVGDLTTWIEHDGFGRDSRWNMLEATAGLARLHDSLVRLRGPAQQCGDTPWRSPADVAQRLRASSERLLGDARIKNRRAPVKEAIATAERALERLADRLAPTSTPFCLTHGDFGGRNVLLRRHRLAGIVDFGRLEERPRLFDLAWVMLFDVINDRLRADHLEFFGLAIDRYARTARTRSELDWATLPHLIAYLCAYGIAEAADQQDPAAEALSWQTVLPLAIEWMSMTPAFLVPGDP